MKDAQARLDKALELLQPQKTRRKLVCARCARVISDQDQYVNGRYLYGECCIDKVAMEAAEKA